MIVEQTANVKTPEEAEDILAGWREMPTFLVAYIRQSTVVGIFECADGQVVRGQKEIRKLEVKAHRTPPPYICQPCYRKVHEGCSDITCDCYRGGHQTYE